MTKFQTKCVLLQINDNLCKFSYFLNKLDISYQKIKKYGSLGDNFVIFDQKLKKTKKEKQKTKQKKHGVFG